MCHSVFAAGNQAFENLAAPYDAIIKVDTERWKKVFPRVIIKTSILPEGRTSLWENI